MQLPPPAVASLRELRVAIWAEQPGHATDPEITAALQALARFLRRAGAKVSLTARPDFDPTEAFHVYLKLLHAALSGRASPEELERVRGRVALLSDDDLSADAVMARGVDLLHRDWLKVNEQRHRIRRAWGTFFQDWHVLICPVIATPALPHMQEGETWERRMTVGEQEIPYNDMLFWPGVIGGFHLPATAAPIGATKSGLPIGAQIVGRLHDDRTTIEVARLLEKHWRGFEPPDGWE
jgi:amidase